ncbi:MAG: DMT family transporter [Microcoleaceae cyanobacterium]
MSVNSNLLAWGLVLIAATNNCVGNLLLKQSRIVAPDSGLLSLLFSPWFIGSAAVYGSSLIIFAKALEHLPISAAYPVLAAVSFILVALAGGWLFGEQLDLNHWIGLGVIIAGIVIMSR